MRIYDCPSWVTQGSVNIGYQIPNYDIVTHILEYRKSTFSGQANDQEDCHRGSEEELRHEVETRGHDHGTQLQSTGDASEKQPKRYANQEFQGSSL